MWFFYFRSHFLFIVMKWMDVFKNFKLDVVRTWRAESTFVKFYVLAFGDHCSHCFPRHLLMSPFSAHLALTWRHVSLLVTVVAWLRVTPVVHPRVTCCVSHLSIQDVCVSKRSASCLLLVRGLHWSSVTCDLCPVSPLIFLSFSSSSAFIVSLHCRLCGPHPSSSFSTNYFLWPLCGFVPIIVVSLKLKQGAINCVWL